MTAHTRFVRKVVLDDVVEECLNICDDLYPVVQDELVECVCVTLGYAWQQETMSCQQ